MTSIKEGIFFSGYTDLLRRTYGEYDLGKFSRTCALFSTLVASAVSGLAAAILWFNQMPLYYSGIVFAVFFAISFSFIRVLPVISLRSKKARLESDLLYSARHLLMRIESGSSLINSLESVSILRTESASYFRQLMFDISFGMPLEDALSKATEYSPSRAYSKILEEIKTSLSTGADLQRTLRGTLDDITRMHLINIQEYGKKLNPMSMFYMILGTMMPSLGTAMLIVAASLLPGVIVIDLRVLMAISFFVLMLQIFFVLAFRSLKPEVMQ